MICTVREVLSTELADYHPRRKYSPSMEAVDKTLHALTGHRAALEKSDVIRILVSLNKCLGCVKIKYVPRTMHIQIGRPTFNLP
jgi:hypothetical protein